MSRRFELDLSTQQQVGMLGSNELVIDRRNSHAHISGEDLELALFQVDSQGLGFLVEEVDCGKTVGKARCVKTTEEDNIVYAYRHDRMGPTRFVLNREPIPTNRITVVLKRHDLREGVMILISAWAGIKTEPEPWDSALKKDQPLSDSQAFWSNHALTLNEGQLRKEIDFKRPHGKPGIMKEYTNAYFLPEPS
jgi:hypothetical protein